MEQYQAKRILGATPTAAQFKINDMNIVKRNFRTGLTLLLIGMTGIAEGQPDWQVLHITLAISGLIITFLVIWQNKRCL